LFFHGSYLFTVKIQFYIFLLKKMNKTIFKIYSKFKNSKISLDIVILKIGYSLSFEILPGAVSGGIYRQTQIKS